MRGIQAFAAAAACAGLGGCASPTLTLGTDGPVRKSVETGIVKTFYDAESSARTSPSDENAQKMLSQGFRLVYANCDEFFNTAGKHQQWIFVARDVVGAVGTIGTSMLALHDGSKMAVSNLALATGVTYSGLDIYTKNFLFSAENIASVRELITKALAEHERGVMALAQFSYESATMHILDNQHICTPAAILSYARDAIKNGRIQSYVSGDTPALQQMADAEVLLRIGSKLNPPGAVTVDQAGALWWLLRDFSSDDDKKKIRDLLADLTAAAQPIGQDGKVVATWTYGKEVGEQLDKLSAATKAKFAAAIQQAREATKAAAAAAVAAVAKPDASGIPAAGAAPVAATFTPKFRMAPPAAATQTTRVGIQVR